jgi:uncharacterized OB-fold protein
MSTNKKSVPAIEGWFTTGDAAPKLLGTRCKKCATYFFPREEAFCRNPACTGNEFEEVALSDHGKLWSFTNNCYPPPAPYVSPDPFEPYAVAAVELDAEKIVVLGQVAAGFGIADLKAGMEMKLVVETLSENADNRYLVWKWKPATAA